MFLVSRPPMLNGYGSSSSSHDVKAEDLTSDAQDVKPNIYALKNEMQASDYSNKGTNIYLSVEDPFPSLFSLIVVGVSE